MIATVIKGPSLREVKKQLQEAISPLVELRLDLFLERDLEVLKKIRENFPIPMIFTLRSVSQGGKYPHSEEKRLQEILKLLTLQPEYVDLEWDISKEFIEKVSHRYPKVKLILSWHTASDYPLQEMQKISATYYKIVQTNPTALACLRFLEKAKKHPNLIALDQGPHGYLSRILAPLIQTPIVYAGSEKGQLPANILLKRYHYSRLNQKTDLLGLIGDPIDKSPSDRTHNHLIQSLGLDAVYVKMTVQKQNLFEFLEVAKQFPFKLLSVTSPLKEKILPYLDVIDKEALQIGAVNTLCFQEGKITGYNTDGKGALNAIEKRGSVLRKRILLIGAGGAARAIAFEALQRGAFVTLLNRDQEKALNIAKNFQCEGGGLEEISTKKYDILINATQVPLPIDPSYIQKGALLLDINAHTTLFLKPQCHVIPGEEMFIEQALLQFALYQKLQEKEYNQTHDILKS